MPNFIELHIRVKPLTNQLEPDDEGVAGTYLVEVDEAAYPGAQTSCALDVFHDHIGISCLEDFSITVMNPRTFEIMEQDDSFDHPACARYVEKVMSGLEGTEFTVTLEAVNTENPKDRANMGSARLVAENIEQVRQRALDLMWDSRLDSASCRPEYTISHETEEIPPPGHLFWWPDAAGNHRARSEDHEYYLVTPSPSEENVFHACIDDRHESSWKSVGDAKDFCQRVESGLIQKRPITRP